MLNKLLILFICLLSIKSSLFSNSEDLKPNSFEMVNGIIFVEAYLNGQAGTYIIDTGSPVLLLNNSDLSGKAITVSSATGDQSIREVDVSSFKWAGLKKINIKELIVATASELFYERGYNLVGINEIIEKSGIAKATLYNHFKSKEDLCLAYLDKRDSEFLKSIRLFCSEKPKGNKRLLAILEFLLSFYKDKKFNGCWCLRTIAEVPKDNVRIRAKVKSNKNNFLEFIFELVSENKSNLTKKKQIQLGRRIYLLYESAVAESHLQNEIWPIDENIDILKTLLKK
jgi:AcrR family transcriptional regulator